MYIYTNYYGGYTHSHSEHKVQASVGAEQYFNNKGKREIKQ